MSRIAFASRVMACAAGIVLLAVCGGPAVAEDDSREIGLEFDVSRSAPELNAAFRPQQGWIGGDGAQSVDLGNGSTLWLFGDTWVGALKDGRRTKARIVHNSAAVQCRADGPCDFVIRENDKGKPVDLISPLDGRGWFWFQAGTMLNGRLYLFMSQVGDAVDPKRPDHSPLGQWLAIVENPLDDPRDWCIEQVKVPFSLYTRRRDLTFGSGVVIEGKYLYVYGIDDASRLQSQDRHLVLARVPLDRVAEMSEWRFLSRGRWTRDFFRPDKIADYMAGDISIAHMPGLNRYLMVYTDCDVSNRIVARTAPSPRGPWSNIEILHTCRDAAADSKLFCYAGKAHPTLSSDGELVLSYLTSSIDTWQVATDARLYWPTFVTVGVRDAHPPESVGEVAKVVPATNGAAAE
ncbi:hypothetical protein Pan44_12230 [Caulifigura coniformis]|uniref:DUF4185 domain-containing protein n=1 Tax=Caulifigura coniformis TaxID=2527983 RepID=A0A517SAP6_9PLAN|nr:DUF4185 domain-containing protein [Caulifigura coniformis]QDT53207.1 hypothetical protein Pan44_12230 [Caulifigura coniformis]